MKLALEDAIQVRKYFLSSDVFKGVKATGLSNGVAVAKNVKKCSFMFGARSSSANSRSENFGLQKEIIVSVWRLNCVKFLILEVDLSKNCPFFKLLLPLENFVAKYATVVYSGKITSISTEKNIINQIA